MRLIPAIDLRAGRCVRLVRGEPGTETVYSEDPVAQAAAWAADGAARIHVVDLDGAFEGRPRHAELVERIVRSAGVAVQVGGGIRDEAAVERYFAAGAAAVVVGTRAVKDPAWFAGLAVSFPGRLVLALDARGSRVAVDGWASTVAASPWDALGRYADLDLEAVLFTQAEADGTGAGPDLEGVRRMVAASPFPVLASGGVAKLEDLRALAAESAAACVVGRALYDRRFGLREAVAFLAGSGS